MHKLFDQLSFRVELNEWMDRGKEAKQRFQRQAFTSMNLFELSTEKKQKKVGSLVFINETRYGSNKGQSVAGRRPQQELIPK